MARPGPRTGACGIGGNFNPVGNPTFTSPIVNLQPAEADHQVGDIWYKTVENDQAWTATFTFQPNGQNISFVIQNSNNNPGYSGVSLSGGAGCEGGFFQGFDANAPPNNVFAVMFDSYSGNTAGSDTFTYSSVRWYQSTESPCNGTNDAPDYWGLNKVSTYRYL